MYKRSSQGWLKHIDFILLDNLTLQAAFLIAYAIRHADIPYANTNYRSFALLLIAIDFFVAAAFNTMHNVLRRGYYLEFLATLKQVLLVLGFVVLYFSPYRRAISIAESQSISQLCCTLYLDM